MECFEYGVSPAEYARYVRALKRPTHKFVPSKSGRIDTCDACGYPSNWSDHERACWAGTASLIDRIDRHLDQPEAASDDELRAMWRLAGGRFYGPNVETGAMPEAQLLPFLRALLHPTPDQPEAAPVAWRCFHCDEIFTDKRCATEHFGRDESRQAACQIKAGAERSMLAALRNAEDDAATAWTAVHNESTDASKAYFAQISRHRDQLRAAEELGYERGLAAQLESLAPDRALAEERMEDALQRIVSWSEAYPLDIFPEPDLKRAREVLEAAGMTLDSLSAYAMRHVITEVGKIAIAALESRP